MATLEGQNLSSSGIEFGCSAIRDAVDQKPVVGLTFVWANPLGGWFALSILSIFLESSNVGPFKAPTELKLNIPSSVWE